MSRKQEEITVKTTISKKVAAGSKKVNSGNRAVFDSVDELAEYLGLSRQNTYKGLGDGTIPGIRLGKRFIVPRAAIQKWLENAGSDLRSAA